MVFEVWLLGACLPALLRFADTLCGGRRDPKASVFPGQPGHFPPEERSTAVGGCWQQPWRCGCGC